MSNVTFSGLFNVVRSDEAVPSSLGIISKPVCERVSAASSLPRRVLLICVGLQRAQQRSEKAISRHYDYFTRFRYGKMTV